MDKKKTYFQLVQTENVAELSIYGEITSWPWLESDVSAYNLSAKLAELKGVTQINVYINSYGGEVAEGLAIYNALRRHPANVKTVCDGMACSIASVIFMAGDERVMSNPSFLMIHDAWTFAEGNADQLRKQAEDLDTITTASVAAYMAHVNISEEDLRALMKAESWLTAEEAVEKGFATGIEEYAVSENPSQNAREKAFSLFALAIASKAVEGHKSEPKDTADKSIASEHANGSTGISEPVRANQNNTGVETPKDKENPVQKWSGFFNALVSE